jgi:hypothetical protein
MPLFSEREGLTLRQETTDDAPQWLRSGFFSQVLEPVLHLDRSSDPFASPTDLIGSPIGVKFLIERISLVTRTDTPANYRNDAMSISALKSQLFAVPWFHFYNSVELVSQLLRGHDDSDGNRSYGVRYFPKFRDETNKFFREAAVGWQLNGVGKLQRTLPAEVSGLEASIISANARDPVALNVAKARGFINQHPCDAANAIKESISAVESAARAIAPGSATVGDAINKLRKQGTYPSLMLSVIEKLYGFANAEPGVRHGSPQEERVVRADAEFVYVTSLAIIGYFRDARK